MATAARSAAQHKYYLKNKARIAAYNKCRVQANLKRIAAHAELYRRRHPERVRAQTKAYYRRNAERCRQASRTYAKNNRALINSKRTEYARKNPSFRLAAALRARILTALKKGFKSKRTLDLLGCSIANFRIYLESKFETGMTWDNYGPVWHVDHIMPCAIFDLTKPEHQKRCFHFSNLQPLFAQDNHRKHAKVLSDQFPLL